MSDDRRICHALKAAREQRGWSIETAANLSKLTTTQIHDLECGLGLFKTAKVYANAGLRRQIVVLNFYRQKNLTAKEMAKRIDVDEASAQKAMRCAHSPVSADDDGLDINTLEAFLFAWSDKAGLALS